MVHDHWVLHFGDAVSTQKTTVAKKRRRIPHIKIFIDDYDHNLHRWVQFMSNAAPAFEVNNWKRDFDEFWQAQVL